ncbi:MAG: hypothetical protein ABII27_08710 [bacterium]
MKQCVIVVLLFSLHSNVFSLQHKNFFLTPPGFLEVFTKNSDIDPKELDRMRKIRDIAVNLLGFRDIPLRRKSYRDTSNEQTLMLSGLVQKFNGEWLLRYTGAIGDEHEVLFVDKNDQIVINYLDSEAYGVMDTTGVEYNEANPFASLPVYTNSITRKILY